MPGELVEYDESPILTACAPLGSEKMQNVILDFGQLEWINGLGASLLVKLAAIASARGQNLLACRVSRQHRKVFEVTGLDQCMVFFEALEDALKSLDISMDDIQLPALPFRLDPRDDEYWAEPVQKLEAPPFPPEAWNLNVTGRRAVGPVNGFGQLWQKIYRLSVSDTSITPEQAIKVMKENFPSLQPGFNRFYPSAAGIRPGEIVAIDSSTPGGPVSTGVLVLYADDHSFTFITPQGHPESGWVTFSASVVEDRTVVQILGLARANDPVYEAAFRAVGSKMQIKIWTHVLTSLASQLGVKPDITVDPTLVDRRMQWSEFGNLWFNAQIRTLLYAPVRILGAPRRKRQNTNGG